LTSTIHHLSSLYDAALSLVYPQVCAGCGASVESRHDGVACAGCWHATRLFGEADGLCWKCGAYTAATVAPENRESIRCGRCETDAFTNARACGFYAGALRVSILNLKREPHVARRLGRMMFALQRREPLNNADFIIPVPLHPARERERGFNQAMLLAKELSRLSGLPLDEHALVRRIHTKRHRAGMDEKSRRRSMEGAFALRHADLVKGSRVLLVDDVFTTGATVSAAAEVLKESGAAKIFVLTVARV